MDNKKVAAAVAIIGALAGVAGAASISLDFSNTEIGQIGDNTINNIIQQGLGVDLNEFKKMCDNDEVHDEFKQYCRLV